MSLLHISPIPILQWKHAEQFVKFDMASRSWVSLFIFKKNLLPIKYADKLKDKGKIYPRTGHDGPQGQ
jgi:hypothetical protein